MLSSAWTRMCHESVLRSNFKMTQKTSSTGSQNSSTLQFQIIRASLLASFNDTREQGISRTDLRFSSGNFFFFWFRMNLLNYTLFSGGAQRTKRDGLGGREVCIRRPVEEANSRVTRFKFVQRVKHCHFDWWSWCCPCTRYWRWGTRIGGVCMGTLGR